MRPAHAREHLAARRSGRWREWQIASPLGPLWAVATADEVLHLLYWAEQREQLEAHWSRWYAGEPRPQRSPLPRVAALLDRYFAGDVAALEGLAVEPRGTSFQRRVWEELRKLPAGATVSYAGVARAVGNPIGVRAVGQAVGKNPIVLAIPCHRVIASDGGLGGYAGGSERKQWLLAHEARRSRQPRG